jgi:hypothetical protein
MTELGKIKIQLVLREPGINSPFFFSCIFHRSICGLKDKKYFIENDKEMEEKK